MTRPALPAVVGGTLLISLGLSLCRICRAPAEQDLDAAAAHVRQSFRVGDLILVEPHTQVGPRERLGDLALREPRMLAVDDLVGFRRAHLVETGALGSDQSSRLILESVGRPTADESFGGVRVSTFELAAREVVFDLRRSVEQLTVIAQYPDGVTRACDRFANGRWSCPRDTSWNWVGRTTLAIDDQPRECVWLHPLRTGGVLRIEFPPLTLESDVEVLAHFGFTRDAASRAAAPVRVRLIAGNHMVLEHRFDVRPGWHPLRGGLARTEVQPLALELTTSNNGAAHFCGALKLVRGGS